MQTLILNQPGELIATDTPPPSAPGPGEARVRVHCSGVCGTDLHAFAGNQPYFTYPRIPGHELGVSVVGVGAGVTNVRAGDRCAVEPYLSCGHCIACRRGRTNCCETLKVLAAEPASGSAEPGTTLDGRLTGATGSRALRITRLQAPGRAAMPADAFLNGRPIPPGTRFG